MIEAFRGVHFLRIHENLQLNLVLEVVLELESDGNTRKSLSVKYSSHAQIKWPKLTSKV